MTRIAIEQDLGFRALLQLAQVWIDDFADLRNAYATPQNLYAAIRDTVYEQADQVAA